LLKQLLNDPNHEWRKLSTLARVIGSSEADTRRLLINIKARGSETDATGESWGLIARHPFASMAE
jgi:hypothetical protein